MYLSNRKWRYASLFSMHAVAGDPPEEAGRILLASSLFPELHVKPGEVIRVEKIM